MLSTIEALPAYLRKYCVTQVGDQYTSRDHAAWRFIMRQSRAYFKDHAVSIYLEGLAKTGITIDKIPMVEDIDKKLRTLGWGAVPVRGFIPPAAFLDFQARRILPIAADMRSVEHIAYTPAPDIVHEAAGHAPILADEAYSEYLTLYAALAQKAIFSREDLDLYEAIRTLSDVKENPDSTAADVKAAEAGLTKAQSRVQFISEANKVARMNWWTVEYGLLGSLENPKIYGAGLLSSVGESQSCLSPKVRKLRLSVDCVDTPYDITEPQPQLFVAEDVAHLCAVLREFETTLSYKRGGVYGLGQARQCATVTTTRLDSGIEISGKLVQFDTEKDEPTFLRYEGPCQLAYDGREMSGQGVAAHPQGFSTPLGRFKFQPGKLPQHLTDAELARGGIVKDRRGRLELTSGFVVEGTVTDWQREAGVLRLISWQDCRVVRGTEEFFNPSWGRFDMAVGTAVTSVSGGPADRERFGTHEQGLASTSPGRTSPFTQDELRSFEAYKSLRRQRPEAHSTPLSKMLAQVDHVAADFPSDWLLRLESIELAYLARAKDDSLADASPILAQKEQELAGSVAGRSDEVRWLVRQGLELAAVPD